jgi:hypothetical protein
LYDEPQSAVIWIPQEGKEEEEEEEKHKVNIESDLNKFF